MWTSRAVVGDNSKEELLGKDASRGLFHRVSRGLGHHHVVIADNDTEDSAVEIVCTDVVEHRQQHARNIIRPFPEVDVERLAPHRRRCVF